MRLLFTRRKKKKKGRKRGRSKTPGNAQAKHSRNITIFCTSKENKEKKKLIRDKVKIENADMRIIK